LEILLPRQLAVCLPVGTFGRTDAGISGARRSSEPAVVPPPTPFSKFLSNFTDRAAPSESKSRSNQTFKSIFHTFPRRRDRTPELIRIKIKMPLQSGAALSPAGRSPGAMARLNQERNRDSRVAVRFANINSK